MRTAQVLLDEDCQPEAASRLWKGRGSAGTSRDCLRVAQFCGKGDNVCRVGGLSGRGSSVSMQGCSYTTAELHFSV